MGHVNSSKKLGIQRNYLLDRGHGAEASFAAASELLSQPHFPARIRAGPTNPTTQAMLITPPGRKYDTAISREPGSTMNGRTLPVWGSLCGTLGPRGVAPGCSFGQGKMWLLDIGNRRHATRPHACPPRRLVNFTWRAQKRSGRDGEATWEMSRSWTLLRRYRLGSPLWQRALGNFLEKGNVGDKATLEVRPGPDNTLLNGFVVAFYVIS